MPGLRFLLQSNPVALDHEGVRVLKEEVQQGRRCEHNRVSRAEVPNPREQATGLADVNGLVQQQADCVCWPKGPVMNNSMGLAADPSRLAALRSLVLTSHPSRMLVLVLDRALPIGRLGGEHRSTCS